MAVPAPATVLPVPPWDIDAGTIGCPLVPWSVHAFYIAGVLHVTAWDFAPYAFLNWMVPVFSILCAMTGFGIWKNGTPARG